MRLQVDHTDISSSNVTSWALTFVFLRHVRLESKNAAAVKGPFVRKLADMSLFHLCANHTHFPLSPFFFTAYTCNHRFPVPMTYVHQWRTHQARLLCTLVKTRAQTHSRPSHRACAAPSSLTLVLSNVPRSLLVFQVGKTYFKDRWEEEEEAQERKEAREYRERQSGWKERILMKG